MRSAPSELVKRLRRRFWWETLLRSALSLVRLLALTRRRSSQLRIVVAWLGLTLKETLGVPPRAGFRVPFEYRGHELSPLVWDRSELEVITEVFVSQQYELAADPDAQVIIDLGSNIGISALYFRIHCPNALIVAVEPDTETFRRLRKNIAHLAGVRLVNAAIAAETGSVVLHSSGHSWEASLYPREGLNQRRQVEALTIDDLVESLQLKHVDVVKADIEGSETAVLPSAEVVRSARILTFEYHAEYADVTLFELIAMLPSFTVDRIHGDSKSHALVTLRRR